MYYGGGQEDAYMLATLAFYGSLIALPLLIVAAIVLFTAAKKHVSHKKILTGFGVGALALALIFGLIALQGKPRCCGEGITFQQTSRYSG